MPINSQSPLNIEKLALALDQVPAGITMIDTKGVILYFNRYAARYTDRKSEYIGKNIRFCHKNEKSIQMIDEMLSDLNSGRKKEIYYENQRNGKRVGVMLSPFEVDGKRVGYIQCFSIIR